MFRRAVFAPLVREYIVADHAFRLLKNDGLPEKMTSRFATLRLEFKGPVITAGFARSWARQGIPMPAYGREVRFLYDAARP